MAEKMTVERDDESYRKSFCCSPKFLYKKLVTKEDPVFLHKIFGFTSLFHYIYRYVYCYYMTGGLSFDGTWFDHFCVAWGMGLSCSSIIFHVLKYRVIPKPLIIWEEYRLHAIIFTLRGVSVYYFAYLWPMLMTAMGRENDLNIQTIVQFFMVMAHHVVVDEITKRYGPGDENMTTVRGKDNSNARGVGKNVLKFYSFYQFSALASHLVPHP